PSLPNLSRPWLKPPRWLPLAPIFFSSAGASAWLQMGVFDDRPPFLGLVLQVIIQVSRRSAQGRCTEFQQSVVHGGGCQDLVQGFVVELEDVRPRSARCQQGVPA